MDNFSRGISPDRSLRPGFPAGAGLDFGRFSGFYRLRFIWNQVNAGWQVFDTASYFNYPAAVLGQNPCCYPAAAAASADDRELFILINNPVKPSQKIGFIIFAVFVKEGDGFRTGNNSGLVPFGFGSDIDNRYILGVEGGIRVGGGSFGTGGDRKYQE
jgi:hypothetical protein